MSEETNTKASSIPAADAPAVAAIEESPEVKNAAAPNGDNADTSAPEPIAEVATEGSAPIESSKNPNTNGEQTTGTNDVTEAKSNNNHEDVEMTDSVKEDEAATAAEPATPASTSKGKGRRKSVGVPEHKNKKLNKKPSKAKMSNPGAVPGDHFFIRLKGYPLWPGIVCDESMLPAPIIKSRPASAAREDGIYREAYADGGPKVNERSFPVMYLHTNEFSWIPNYDLISIDEDDLTNPPAKMRKDLVSAYRLAAEKNDLQHYKDILLEFIEIKQAELEAKEAAKAAKAVKKPKAPRKSEVKVVEEGDVDVEMADAVGEAESEEAETVPVEKPTKKRKAKDVVDTPERVDSVKKPRPTIKLTNIPKATNGVATPKTVKDPAVPKSTQKKTKKPAKEKATEREVAKKPELTAEEERVIKGKEILFLRHKLQKGLLTRDQEPKEEEMKQMADFVTKLEGYAELEVSIIRATKINKVLKAILKLPTIPREEEFQFKARSQTLLEKWNTLLASEQAVPAVPATTNGTIEEERAAGEEIKASSSEPTNGVKPEEPKIGDKASTEESPATETKEEASDETSPVEESVKEETAELTKLDSTS